MDILKGNTRSFGRNKGGVDNLFWISSYNNVSRFQCTKYHVELHCGVSWPFCRYTRCCL